MTCSRNFDRLLQATCLGLVGMLAVAGCGGSSNNPDAKPQGEGGTIPGGEAGVPAGTLTIAPVSVTFGSVDVGATSATAQIVTVTNSGAAAVPIIPSVTGPFAISQTCVSVPAKGNCQISVVFTPTAVGPVSGVLSITGTLAVSLSGTGVPAGNFSVTDVPLGQVATNAVVPGAVTVTATAPVTDLSCSLSGADLTADPTKVCPAVLAAGASCTVGFTFKATTSGQKTDSVVCNAAGLTKTAVVSATVLDPAKLVITPPSTTFQTPNGTQSAPVTFGVANSGGIATGQVSATITGTNANQFAITVPGCLAPLSGASGCTVQVVCNPTSVGTKTATLTVADATTATDTVSATLTCVSVGPTTITVTGTANLGAVVVGNTGTAQTFTVTNTGTTATGTLTVTVGDPTQFVVGVDTCSGTSLAPAATCTISVALKPSAPGQLGTVLNVTNAGGAPGSIQLSGTGLPPGALTIAPASNDFGSIPVNTVSADVSFTVINGGGAATGALTVNAPGNGFVVSGNGCAAALQPTQTCVIAVHFAPTIVGNASGTLTVTDGTLSGSASLHGTATPAAALVIDPATTCAAAEVLFDHAVASCAGPLFPATVIGQTNGSYPDNATPPPAGITFTVYNGTATTPSTTDTGALTFTTSGDAKADFVIAKNNCPATLPPGASCTVVVNFTPTAAGARAALLQVSTVKGGNAAANLNGLGLAFIQILPCSLKDGTFPPGGPAGTCTPLDATLGTNFGQVSSGVFDPSSFPNQEKVFVVRIRGTNAANFMNTMTLSLSTGVTPADFRVSNAVDSNCNNYVANVSAGYAQCEVILDFFPQSGPGDKTGTLTITGSGGGSDSVNVTGTATGPLTFNPAPVDFGSVAVGSVAMTSTTLSVTTVTVTNHGAVAQGPLAFTLTGTNAGEFATVDDNCTGQTLAASGGFCTLSFIMLPSSTGAKTATLTVTAGTQSSTVAFEGNGTSQTTITVSPATNDFAGVAATNESAYLAVTVTAVGTAETGNVLYGLSTCSDFATSCNGFEIAQASSSTDPNAVGTCGVTDTQHLGGANPASCTIRVRFHPAQMLGLQSVNLRVTEARSGQIVDVPLKGTSTSQLTLSAASHDFGLVPASGASAVYNFTVTNAGLTTVTPLVNFINTDLVPTALDARLNTNSTSTTCGTGPLGVGATCVVAVSISPAPNTPDQLLTSTLVVNAPVAPSGLPVVVPQGVADAEALLTASIVNQAQLQVVGFTHFSGYNNMVNFGTVPQGGTSSNVTIWYTNVGDVATTAIHYLWHDSSSPSAGVLLTDTPDPYFPFVGDVGSTPCAGASLAPGGLCSVTFHLAAGSGAGSFYMARLELNATNAGLSDTILAMGEGAASTGAAHIVPSFLNFSPTASTAIGASTTAQTFQLFGPASGAFTSSNADFVIDPTAGATPCTASVSLATASASCTFAVTFTPGGDAPPTGDQYRLGTVSVGGAVAGFIGKVQEPATLVFQTASGGNDFGNVIRNVRSAAKTMTITNMGDVASAALTLVTAPVGSASAQAIADAGRFAPGTECNRVINPGETCSFSLTVLANASVALPQGAYSIEVEAMTGGTTPTVVASSDPISAQGVDAAALSLTPSNTVTFTDQPVGTVGATTVFTIQNGVSPTPTQNSGVLTITLAPAANYDVDMTDCSAATSTVLNKGLVGPDSCVVTIAFHPALGVTLGSLPAVLTVASPAGGTVSVNVTGKAISPMAFVANDTSPSGGALFTTLATTPTDFGTLAVGTAPVIVATPHQVIQLWVENAAGAPPTGLLSTALTGSNFRLIWDNCVGERLGFTSGGSRFCDMGVRFEPSATGAQTGTLTVSGTPGTAPPWR